MASVRESLRRKGLTEHVEIETVPSVDIAGQVLLRIGRYESQATLDELIPIIDTSEHGDVNSLLRNLNEQTLLDPELPMA